MNATASAAPVAVHPGDGKRPDSTTTSATVVAAQPIPYRKESNEVGGSVIGVLLVTVALLAVFVVVLRVVKSRGVLDRWIVNPPPRETGKTLQVEQSLRVGSRTMVHRIRDGGRRYLLVESTAPGVQLVALEDEHLARPGSGNDDSL